MRMLGPSLLDYFSISLLVNVAGQEPTLLMKSFVEAGALYPANPDSIGNLSLSCANCEVGCIKVGVI